MVYLKKIGEVEAEVVRWKNGREEEGGDKSCKGRCFHGLECFYGTKNKAGVKESERELNGA